MDRSNIKDAGVLAVFERVLTKPFAELNVGELNFIEEWKEYFSPEELARFTVVAKTPIEAASQDVPPVNAEPAEEVAPVTPEAPEEAPAEETDSTPKDEAEEGDKPAPAPKKRGRK
jgi:hypothetical protein